MAFIEDSMSLSLFSDNISIWGQLHDEGEFNLGNNFASQLKEDKVLTLDSLAEALSPESDISGDDPMPEWMSKKVPLSAWLGDEEDIPMADLMTIPSSQSPKSVSSRAEELLNELLVDVGIPPTPPSSGEDQSAEALLALSPASSLSLDSPVSIKSMSPASTVTPASPVATNEPSVVLSILPGGDVEAQALALLDAMGCMEFSELDQNLLKIFATSVTPSEDQMEVTEQYCIPESPVSIQSQLSAQSPVSLNSPVSPLSPQDSPVPSPDPTPVKRTKPRLKNASPVDRKARKRDQNKQAATRYRVKKRIETDSTSGVLGELEEKNQDLKEKVEGLSTEIKYLKDLLIEVHKLKGQINTVKPH